MLKFLNKNSIFKEQKGFLVIFFTLGFPIGYLITQGLIILSKSWAAYHFSPINFVGTLVVDFILILPLIINYFKCKKKYKSILNKHLQNKNNSYQVKALFNYNNFIKGQTYKIQPTKTLIPRLSILYI